MAADRDGTGYDSNTDGFHIFRGNMVLARGLRRRETSDCRGVVPRLATRKHKSTLATDLPGGGGNRIHTHGENGPGTRIPRNHKSPFSHLSDSSNLHLGLRTGCGRGWVGIVGARLARSGQELGQSTGELHPEQTIEIRSDPDRPRCISSKTFHSYGPRLGSWVVGPSCA